MKYDTTLENYVGTRHEGRLDTTMSGSREMQVDLSELDAYVALVQRASDDLTAVGASAASGVSQSDFGPILEVMTGAYNALVPRMHETLEQDGTRMGDHAEALKATARDFTLTEAGVAQTYGTRGYDARNGSTAFRDVVETTVARPRATQGELPTVSFGQPYDLVCDLIAALTGFDVRAELAERIGGDTVGASTQGSCWGAVGRSVGSVATNLESGAQTIAGSWSGTASASARSNMAQWVSKLDAQAGRMVEMGETLVQICKDAWQTATCVVETIRSAVQAVSSALATMSIPGVGWARVVQACYQAFQALMKALNVLKKFFNILKSVKAYAELVKDQLDPAELPSATATA